MKKILTVVAASLMSLTAFGQSTTSPSHMIDFDADTVLQGSFNLDSSKTKGQKKDNDTQLQINLNYAYTLPMLRNLQLGGRLDYNKGTDTAGDYENYGADIGAIWNFGMGQVEPDLMNSIYASLFVGYGWANNYGGDAPDDDEVFRSTVALGKRFDLTRWGVNHLVYSPEVALQSLNSKTGGAIEYSQSVQFRFLQFSVLF